MLQLRLVEAQKTKNASEWGKRERLKSEKLALERDNKKLRAELRDYQERSDRKCRPIQANDVELRALQQELSEPNKEISEVKMSHAKLKNLLAKTNSELSHAVRRAKQYEAELNIKLDVAMKEAYSLKREKNNLELQITQLKKEMEKLLTLMMKHAGQFHRSDTNEDAEAYGRDANCSPDISSDGLKNSGNSESVVAALK
ncbi:GH23166 [Drosophila grimshawi]|uniref:GH23166 n=1 Tax=Drosophila grimshawi TaxID=7222 RepID=B4K1I6_DROGR|nr:GH23166 [Drosophila grimshawi]